LLTARGAHLSKRDAALTGTAVSHRGATVWLDSGSRINVKPLAPAAAASGGCSSPALAGRVLVLVHVESAIRVGERFRADAERHSDHRPDMEWNA